jgi:predicted transcriptional regulator
MEETIKIGDADPRLKDIDSRLIEGLAELLIKEPSSLEVMLMLTDKGPMTIEEISNEIIYGTMITDLLNKLKRVKVIGFINNLVYITSYGQYIIKKLRDKTKEREKGGLIYG